MEEQMMYLGWVPGFATYYCDNDPHPPWWECWIWATPGPSAPRSHTTQTLPDSMLPDVTPQVPSSQLPWQSIDWSLLIAASNAASTSGSYPILAKSTMSWDSIGPAFFDDTAKKNEHEMNPTDIHNTLLMMVYLKLFIPLSILTTTPSPIFGIMIIWSSRKSHLGALPESVLWMKHTSPLNHLSLDTCRHISTGWHWSHSGMSWLSIKTGRLIMTEWLTCSSGLTPGTLMIDSSSFMNCPFIFDPDSMTYHHQFEHACIDAWTSPTHSGQPMNRQYGLFIHPTCHSLSHATCAFSSNNRDTHYLPYDNNRSADKNNSAQSFHALHNPNSTLCLWCGAFGCRVQYCSSSSNCPDHPLIVVMWKNNRLVNKVVMPFTSCPSCSTSKALMPTPQIMWPTLVPSIY